MRDKPIDQPARDVITDVLDTSLFVEAGAGSGKTSSVVKRIVELVRADAPIEKIAAITFTEAAAAELRRRVGKALQEQAGRDPKCAAALRDLDTAAFTTVHGFALRLLSSFPLAAGLPPAFNVADEVNTIVRFDQAWAELRRRVGDDEDLAPLQERSAAAGTPLTKFVEMAHFFDDNWDRIDRIPVELPALSPLDFDDLLDELIDLRALADSCADPDDKLAKRLLSLSEDGKRIRGEEPVEQFRQLGVMKVTTSNLGVKANWTDPSKSDVAAQVDSLQERLAQRLGLYTDEILRSWAAVLAEFTRTQVADRMDRGELGFHDLLVLARRLLRDCPTERDQLASQYRYLLLDEFQDTDPIQIELAVLLCHPGPVGDRSWPELAAEIRPGSLVVVGDPKQSIYRFRRADYRVYATAQDALDADDVALTVNFRSGPGILQWVNDVFGEAMGSGTPGVQPPYVNLDPSRGDDLGPDAPFDGPVWTLGGANDEDLSAEIRRQEAADVARACARIVGERWTVLDGLLLRPAELNDIAVLIPSRLSLPSLEQAFSAAGIPLRPETRSLVYATAEVTEVLSGLRAIAQPGERVAVVAALRSGLFNVTDAELVRWYQAGGGWDFRLPAPDRGHSAVAAAFIELKRWYDSRLWHDPASLIRRIITERRLREVALAQPRHRDRWRRYRFLTEQARAFSAQSGGDLQDFLVWADLQASESAGVAEPIAAESDDHAVRVLTVHGSKGLEFPAVVLAGSPTVERNGGRGVQVIFDDNGGFECKVNAGRATESFDLQASVEDAMSAQERIRLQYVAATRAKDYLVVSLHHKKGSNSGGSRWNRWIEASAAPCTPMEFNDDQPDPVLDSEQLSLDDGEIEAAARRYRDHRVLVAARNDAARSTSPTRLARELSTNDDETSLPADRRWPPSDGSGEDEAKGSDFGSAVHEVLAQLDLTNPTDVAARSAAAAAAFGLPEQGAEVARRVEFALKSPTVVAAAAQRHHQELPVAIPWGDGVLEGYVDLLIERDGGYIVVDYKTDALPAPGAAGLEALVERYRIQAAAYAEAVAAITDRPVHAARFVVLTSSGAFEADVADLDGARALLRSSVG